MELSAEAMAALNKAMAAQIKESNQAIATQLTQQIEQLNDKFETQMKDLLKELNASEAESSDTPTPSEAMRIAKGKGHAGASVRRSRRDTTPFKVRPKAKTNRSQIGGRETMFNQRKQDGSRVERQQGRQHRREEYIAGQRVFLESDPEYYEEEEASDHSLETVRRDRGRGNGRDFDPLRQQLSHIKIQYPPFQGTNDPEVYLDWERKMESNFLVQGTYEANKVKIAVSEFSGYALLWWEQLGITRQRHREPPITTWDQLVTQMRKRFVPAHYQREILNKLRRLIQGTRSVRDYYQELETLMIRADLSESEDMVMAR